MRLARLISTIIIFGFISGCDYYSQYTLIIDNQTNDTITILFEGSSAVYMTIDSAFLLPNMETILYDYTGTTVFPDHFECGPIISEDEITVKISSNRQLLKDLTLKENWNCETDANTSFWRISCVIDENDLE